MSIILASQSPRRRQLLGQIGLDHFIVRPARGEEIMDPALSPAQLGDEADPAEGREVAGNSDPMNVVIAADTVVAIDGRVLGKPHDREEACAMLSALSGREHTVYTGVTVCRDDRMLTQHEATQVRFRPLSPREIQAYVDSGEPMDKAGAYGVQELGALLVEGIRGDYFNVVGLPLCRLGQMLSQFGVELLAGKEEQKL